MGGFNRSFEDVEVMGRLVSMSFKFAGVELVFVLDIDINSSEILLSKFSIFQSLFLPKFHTEAQTERSF